MCLTEQSEPTRLGKDKNYWKVFAQRSEIAELATVHNKQQTAEVQGKANKKFAERNGYQVFETREQARIYSSELFVANCRGKSLFPRYPVKKVLVKRGALKVTGIIKYGFICAGHSAIRVSSYTICES